MNDKLYYFIFILIIWFLWLWLFIIHIGNVFIKYKNSTQVEIQKCIKEWMNYNYHFGNIICINK
jgi:hypothetical protein